MTSANALPGTGLPRPRHPQPVGESPGAQQMRSMARTLGLRSCTVLIRGESGTGKELFARHMHECSPRCEKPFVAVDCTTLRDTLFESQLFGHVKGAFTGAEQATVGFLRSANGGTLFLDEIGEMALPVQAKLLRCIQDRAVIPLGSSVPVALDIRFVAATHRDLRAMVRRGEFREDLFYRLNVVEMIIPPLRERPSDIPLLARHYLRHFGELYGEPAKVLTDEAMDALVAHAWPGNVRELANSMEQMHILCPREVIHAEDLPGGIRPEPAFAGLPRGAADIPTLASAERTLVSQALEATGGNQSRAAEILQIDRRRLRRKIRMYGLQAMLRHEP